MTECEECGEVYEPETDAYRCPVCGAENYPDDGEAD
jgi:Zn finger protein HypA/HybF involved in hydrogenase expression